jgi:phosphoenolpyruvate carboxylase
MIQALSGALEKFRDQVGIKFQLYNSLFLSLPFFGVDKTGILLSLFSAKCEEGYDGGKSPVEIIDGFFADNSSDDPAGMLFRFVQYAERQVVLFDALEESAFAELNDLQGAGTLKQLLSNAVQNNKLEEFAQKLENFSVRLVLTAHPTQFYPGTVLGIINDLVQAIKQNDVSGINTLLQQLGRTPFFKKTKPTAYDEGVSLIWYLENVFYDAIGNIVSELKDSVSANADLSSLIRMGFWPGGDRDGNPFVTADTTVGIANALRSAILRCYYRDVRRLKRRLTFTGVDAKLFDLETRLYAVAFGASDNVAAIDAVNLLEITGALAEIREMIVTKHDGLFLRMVDDLISKVETFGLYFASLDIRQESSAHEQVLERIAAESDALPENYTSLSDDEKIAALVRVDSAVSVKTLSNDLAKDTLNTIGAVKNIRQKSGYKACERYIISQCHSALNAVEVYGLFLLGGWQPDELNIDIVPLFETIADLEKAAGIMRKLYELPAYRAHLARRNDTQTIMLGFSDGTKDGGYLMANWSIYKAKDTLTALAKKFGIGVVFFDGRGGPPARGGGKTHKFYSSMGENIANEQIQLTVQGQTVSSNFGTVVSAQYNIEQLLHAGINDHLFVSKPRTFTGEEEALMQSLADHSFHAYQQLKEHPQFLEYLSRISPLRFYAETNIGSRPSKRGAGKLTLDGLRAIPFVGAWSQLKQNVPGYYGMGAALQKMEARLDEIGEMYRMNSFFKTLVDNCEMAMQKCFFPLTAFVAADPEFGEIWRMIRDEFELCRVYLSKISGKAELMEDYPVEKQSVSTRERIVVPLVTIQQYAITKLRELEGRGGEEELKNTYEKLVIRCSFGIINAGRNSA